jgi:single-stranded DNA-binding protein
MISERTFTIQGKVVKVKPIAATSSGVQFGVIGIQTEEVGQDGQSHTAHYAVECWGKSLENVYPKAKEGQIVKVQGTINSKAQQTRDGSRKFLSYTLKANYITVDPDSKVDEIIPEEPIAPAYEEPSNPLMIDPDDLPF